LPGSIDKEKVFVRVDVSNIYMPLTAWRLIEPVVGRLDYDYVGGKKLWRMHANQTPTTEYMHENDFIAMKVAEKLER
jgi:hypothetical protein